MLNATRAPDLKSIDMQAGSHVNGTSGVSTSTHDQTNGTPAASSIPVTTPVSPIPATSATSSAATPVANSPAATTSADQVIDALRAELEPFGFECHPLLVGWYNAHVAAGFHLTYPAATLALVIISTPDMFEHCFVPHLRRRGRQPAALRDPIDDCMRHVLAAAARSVHAGAHVLHDFELSSTRRPRVLVQTAGHVSGAVRLYRRDELREDPWPELPAVMGVCLHPEYGGWFALRALIVMEGVEAPDLPRPQPPEILATEEEKRAVIELFNWHWRDWRYRDVGGARQRYSPLQREYFGTPPGERQALVERIAGGETPTEEARE